MTGVQVMGLIVLIAAFLLLGAGFVLAIIEDKRRRRLLEELTEQISRKAGGSR